MDLITAAPRGGQTHPSSRLPTTHTNLHPHQNHDQSQPPNSNQRSTQHSANRRDAVTKPTARRFRGSFMINANSNINTNGSGQGHREQGGGDTTRRSRRKPGRPRGSKNKPKPPIIVTHDITPNTLTSHVIEVEDGWDIMEGVADFARRTQRGVCVLSGNGCVSDVTISQMVAPNASTGGSIISTLHGRFGILSLSGTFLPPTFQPPTSSLTVYLAGRDGQVVGGDAVGPLRASGVVFIMAASFASVLYERVPSERGAAGGVGEVGLAPPMQRGNNSSGNHNGNGMGSSWLRIDGQSQPQPQPQPQPHPQQRLERQSQRQHQPPRQPLQQEDDQLQLLGDPTNNNNNPATSDDLLQGLPSNIMSSCQLSLTHDDGAYWAGAEAGPFAF